MRRPDAGPASPGGGRTRLEIPAWHVRVREALVVAAGLVALAGVLLPVALPAVVETVVGPGATLLDLVRLVLVGVGASLVLGAAGALLPLRRGFRSSLPFDLARMPAPFALAWWGLALLAGVLAWELWGWMRAADLPPGGWRWLAVPLALLPALFAMGLAVAWPLRFRVEGGEADERAAPAPPAGPPRADPVAWIEAHTAYRAQVARRLDLPPLRTRPAAPARAAEGIGRQPLLAGAAGRDRWRSADWDAAEAFVDAFQAAARSEPGAVLALSGWPGAGRARLLVELLEVLRRGLRRTAIVVTAGAEPAELAGLGGSVRRVRAGEPLRLDPDVPPDFLVCEAEAFAATVVRTLVHGQPPWLWSLGGVVLLDPHRLGREGLLHVREALTRLRTVLLARGRDLACVITVPPVDNRLALAERIANRADVRLVELDRPCPAQRLVHWRPPPRLLEAEAWFVPAPVQEEVRTLLQGLALAAAAGGSGHPARILVWDVDRSLTPDGWDALRDRLRLALRQDPAGAPEPEWTVAAGFAPPRPAGPPRDAVLLLVASPALSPLVEAARGLLREGGVLVVLEGPGVDLEPELALLEAGGEPPPVSLPVPVAPGDLRRASWWGLLEDLAPGSLLPRSRVRDPYGDDAWEELRDFLEHHGLADGGLDRVFVGQGEGVALDEAAVRPERWSIRAAARVPWGCITCDRLEVRNVGAGADELEAGVRTLDRFRLFHDWLPRSLVTAGPHALRVLGVRGERELEVTTPGREEARRGGRVRPWREVEVTAAEVERRLVRGPPGSGLRLVVETGELEVVERLRGHWATPDDLHPDPRRVGAPLEHEHPPERRFRAWGARVRWEGERAPDRVVAATLLGAWVAGLAERWWGIAEELDVALVEAAPAAAAGAGDGPAAPGLAAGPAWLVHRRIPAPEPVDLAGWLPDDGMRLRELLQRLAGRLRRCTCEDGCSACCARLGDCPAALVERGELDRDAPGERVSRRAALAWLAAFLAPGGAWPEAGPPEPSALVAEVVGTAAAGFRDGLVHRLLGERLALPPERVAEAGYAGRVAGVLGDEVHYVGGARNALLLRPVEDRRRLVQRCLHGYVHNWQLQGEGFDRVGWLEAGAYGGALLAEGHAAWVEVLHLLRTCAGGLVRAEEVLRWEERAAAWALVDLVVRTYGLGGLHLLLAGPAAMEGVHPPARGPRGDAPWPLDLPTAVRLAGLEGRLGPEGAVPVDFDLGSEEDEAGLAELFSRGA